MTGTVALRATALAFTATMLWGCGGPPGSPWYQTPPGVTGANGATVSMTANPTDAAGAHGDTRVVTVDGKPVSGMDFDKVVLPPGEHTLGVEYNGVAATATVPFRASLRSGGTYAVKGEKDGPCDAKLWLEDESTNQALGNATITHVVAKPTMNGAPVFAVACN